MSGDILSAPASYFKFVNIYVNYFNLQLLLNKLFIYTNVMPLDYQILQKKSTMTVKDRTGLSSNKVKALNLLSKTYNDSVDLATGITFIEVSHEYIGRPDLVALAIYGDEEYADILCKFNGISNPFELNEGMILWCPRAEAIDELATRTNDAIGDGIVSEDEEILENNTTTNNNKKLASATRSPNEATITDHNYTVTDDNQYIIY